MEHKHINYLKEQQTQILNDPLYLYKFSKKEHIKMIDLIHFCIDNHIKVFSFRYTQTGLLSFNRLDLTKEYELLKQGQVTLREIGEKLHKDPRNLKICFYLNGFDLSFVELRSGRSKNKQKQALYNAYGENTINSILTLIKTNYYEDVIKQFPILKHNQSKWQLLFEQNNIKVQHKTQSQIVKETSERQYLLWKQKNYNHILSLLKQNMSLKEISQNLFNGYKKNYLQRFVKEEYENYDSFLDTIYSYTQTYGEKEVQQVLKKHNGKLNPMYFNNVRAKNKKQHLIVLNEKKKQQYKEIVQDEEKLKETIKNNWITPWALLRKNKQVYSLFFKKFPQYNIWANQNVLNKSFEKIKQQNFIYTNKQHQILEQIIHKYPQLLVNWPKMWDKKDHLNWFYGYIMYQIYTAHDPKYLNMLLTLNNQKPYFSARDFCQNWGFAGYDSISVPSLIFTKNKYLKILHDHTKLRKQYYESYHGTNADYWKEMELLQIKNLKLEWFNLATQRWNKWSLWVKLINYLNLKTNNTEIVNKLISSLYFEKYNKHLHIDPIFSVYEEQVFNFLADNNIHFFDHVKDIISPLEIDFFIPQQNIAIELNPTYTHNSTYNAKFISSSITPKKDPLYHWQKYKQCQKKNVELISLFERDLVEPTWSNFTKPFLLFKLKGAEKVYYARQIKLQNITNNKEEIHYARSFISKYHEQGNVNAQYYYKILNKNNSILGYASFGNNQQYHKIELKRLVFKPNIQIRYGLSKIIFHFLIDYPQYNEIYSYSNNNIGNGKSYLKAGFKFIKETKPTLKYVNIKNANDQYSWSIATSWGAKSGVIAKDARQSLQLTNKEAENYVQTKLKHRTDNGHGYVKVFDTGNKLWKYTRKG